MPEINARQEHPPIGADVVEKERVAAYAKQPDTVLAPPGIFEKSRRYWQEVAKTSVLPEGNP